MTKKICFSKKIYTPQAIESTITEFSHLASFRVAHERDYFIVSVDAIDAGVTDVFEDEFCDFVFAESHRMRKRS